MGVGCGADVAHAAAPCDACDLATDPCGLIAGDRQF